MRLREFRLAPPRLSLALCAPRSVRPQSSLKAGWDCGLPQARVPREGGSYGKQPWSRARSEIWTVLLTREESAWDLLGHVCIFLNKATEAISVAAEGLGGRGRARWGGEGASRETVGRGSVEGGGGDERREAGGGSWQEAGSGLIRGPAPHSPSSALRPRPPRGSPAWPPAPPRRLLSLTSSGSADKGEN